MRKEDTFTKDYMKEHTGAVDTKNVAHSYEVQKIMHEQDDLEDTNRPNDDQNKKTITESKGNSAEKLLEKNAWHPGFVAAASLELRNEKNLLLIPERNLSKEPLRIDLFIQNGEQRIIQNEIGHLFRTYNIIEYKSPDDSLSVDDIYKTIGYACLLKGLGEKVNEYPEEEITVSLFRDSYPRELFAYLKEKKRTVEEKYPGIYYIKGGMLFPVQIIVTKRLDPKHAGLRILSNHAQEQDVRRFLEEAEKMKNPGDRKNIDAVLQVSATANRELYKKIREDSIMCEALRELMKDELAEERKEGIKEGLINSIKNLMDTMSLSVEQAMDALKIPANNREMYLSIITGLNKNS